MINIPLTVMNILMEIRKNRKLYEELMDKFIEKINKALDEVFKKYPELRNRGAIISCAMISAVMTFIIGSIDCTFSDEQRRRELCLVWKYIVSILCDQAFMEYLSTLPSKEKRYDVV